MIKRDRQSLFHKEPKFLTSSAAHVSLSLYAIVKEQTDKPSKLPAETLASTNQHPPIKETFRTKIVVASSAAALVQ
ncbi:hypothetical protein [Ensifer adhaerens]|uniref:hypothetical protein n=1 Tax=Ensifer adhaerens TaxID=106592 RepID=UPI00156A338A|nr:hypothetical protein [Ensifer adhaerens]